MNNNNDQSRFQQSSNNGLSVYFHKKSLLRALQDYEFERRKCDRNFDVYEFIGELLGHTSTTIRKFFQKFDRTGTKLGTEDLLRVCILLGTDAPILALLDDYNCLVNPSCQDKLSDKKKMAIKDNMLEAVKKIGDLSGSVSSALADDKLTRSEKEDLRKLIGNAKNELTSLECKIEE